MFPRWVPASFSPDLAHSMSSGEDSETVIVTDRALPERPGSVHVIRVHHRNGIDDDDDDSRPVLETRDEMYAHLLWLLDGAASRSVQPQVRLKMPTSVFSSFPSRLTFDAFKRAINPGEMRLDPTLGIHGVTVQEERKKQPSSTHHGSLTSTGKKII